MRSMVCTSFGLLCVAAVLWVTTAASASEWCGSFDRRAFGSIGRRRIDRREADISSLSEQYHRRRRIRRTAHLAGAGGEKALVHLRQACDSMIDTARDYLQQHREAQTAKQRNQSHQYEHGIVFIHTVITKALGHLKEASSFEAHFDHFVGNAGGHSEGASVGIHGDELMEYVRVGRGAGLRIRLPRSIMKDAAQAAMHLRDKALPPELLDDPRIILPEAVDFLITESDSAGAAVAVHPMRVAPAEPIPALRAQLAKLAAELERPRHAIMLKLHTDPRLPPGLGPSLN